MALAHEEYRFLVAKGLAGANRLMDLTGSGVYQASATTVDQYKANNITQESGVNVHECDRCGQAQSHNRTIDTLVNVGAFDNSDVVASNDAATWRAQFTEDDLTLPPNLQGGRD